MPYTTKGMDLSLSGLLTATSAYTQKSNFKKVRESDDDFTPEDLCFTLQEVAFAMLVYILKKHIRNILIKIYL